MCLPGESGMAVVTSRVKDPGSDTVAARRISARTVAARTSLIIDAGGSPLAGPARLWAPASPSLLLPLGRTAPNELRRFIAGIRAWMVLLPVDALLLVTPALWYRRQLAAFAAFSLLSLLLITGGERFRARLHLSVLDELPGLLGRLLIAAATVATVLALQHPSPGLVEGFLRNAALATGLVVAGRTITTALVAWSRRLRLTAHPTVLIGGGPLAGELAQKLRQQPRYGLSVVGFVDDGADRAASMDVPRLGALADLDAVVRATGADVLVVIDGAFSEVDVHEAVRTEHCLPCDLLVVPRLHDFATQTGRADHIGSIPIMRVRAPKLVGPARRLKRAFDVVVSGLALLFVSPALGLLALAVRWEGRDVIFRQPRVGQNGEIFDLLKFRSMQPADAVEAATTWSIACDARVGSVGRLLRRTSLDELPQLWNILRGDMSLVGPRPERPHFVEQFSQQYSLYAKRHRVKAGLTGLAQVSGLRGDTSIADRARYDNFYIEHWSLWLDIKILVRTVTEVLFARGR